MPQSAQPQRPHSTAGGPRRPLVEICAEGVESAIAAEAGGADRVELCAGLCEGGTTPSAATIALARERVSLPIHVLIRPRGGDFCYSSIEQETMVRDVREAIRRGVDGVVIGALRPDGAIDREATVALIDAARHEATAVFGGGPFSITFHRAFDLCRDPFEALDVLFDLGVDCLLTSGQAESAEAGAALIAELAARAGGRLSVMAGGGINAGNARRIVAITGVREIHLSARAPVVSPMRPGNPALALGGPPPTQDERRATDARVVREVVNALSG